MAVSAADPKTVTAVEALRAVETLNAVDLRDPAVLYENLDKEGLVRLRFLPPDGEERRREAFLLLVYGFRLVRGEEPAPVTRLKNSLVRSGVQAERVDVIADPFVAQALMVKGGTGKGGNYRLTTTGLTRARELAARMAAQLG